MTEYEEMYEEMVVYESMRFGTPRSMDISGLEKAKERLERDFYNGARTRGIVLDGNIGYVVVDKGFEEYKHNGITIVEIDK